MQTRAVLFDLPCMKGLSDSAILHAFYSILGHIRVSRDGAEALEQEERARDRPHQVREIAPRHAMMGDCNAMEMVHAWNENLLNRRDVK